MPQLPEQEARLVRGIFCLKGLRGLQEEGKPESSEGKMSVLEKATRILDKAYGGNHHIPGQIKDKGHYVECNVYDDLSTFDNTRLTRLVLGAHDECCRMTIKASGPGRLKLQFSVRQRPEDCGDFPIMRGHATIEQAIQVFRNGERNQQLPMADSPPSPAG